MHFINLLAHFSRFLYNFVIKSSKFKSEVIEDLSYISFTSNRKLFS